MNLRKIDNSVIIIIITAQVILLVFLNPSKIVTQA
jgi:hypothetical protein